MSQHDLYEQAVATFSPALERLARGYEADSDKRRDFLQEIHLAIWRSLESFAAQCSLRTWVYRVAHNVAASHVLKHRRARVRPLVSLEEAEHRFDPADTEASIDRQNAIDQLYALIEQLNPLDREVILLYLEETDAASIGEITGISPGNVATKIHRIKKILADRFREGVRHAR
jgi:RNA polymerase sigma-70 factor (ECF subfamily)